MSMKYLKVFYDWLEATKHLKPAQKGELIDAMVKYARGDPDVESGLKGAALILFPTFQRQIDADKSAYADISAKRKEAGAKGGKQKQANASKSYQDKDQDKDTVAAEAATEETAAAARPGFDTVEAYAANNLQALSIGNMSEFADFKAAMPEDVIRHAIDEACAAGKRSWAYVRAILMRYQDSGFKTIGDVKAAEQQRTAEKNKPADTGGSEVKWW